MPHDFVRFPELTNSQLPLYYSQSPHRQILSDFEGEVTKVTDGDTIRVKWEGRDFDFPVRFINTDSPELNAKGGLESKEWLKNQILNKTVEVRIDYNNRVGKWGRIIGHIYHKGLNMGEMSINAGKSTPFNLRREGEILGLEDLGL